MAARSTAQPLFAARIVGPQLLRGRTFPPRRGRSAGGASPTPPPRVRRALLAGRSYAAPCAAAPTRAPAPLVGARLTPPRANLAGVPSSVGLLRCRERSKLSRRRHQRHDRRCARVARAAPRRRSLLLWRRTFPPPRAARARLRLERCRSAHAAAPPRAPPARLPPRPPARPFAPLAFSHSWITPRNIATSVLDPCLTWYAMAVDELARSEFRPRSRGDRMP